MPVVIRIEGVERTKVVDTQAQAEELAFLYAVSSGRTVTTTEVEKDPNCGVGGCEAHDGECADFEAMEARFNASPLSARLGMNYETFLST